MEFIRTAGIQVKPSTFFTHGLIWITSGNRFYIPAYRQNGKKLLFIIVLFCCSACVLNDRFIRNEWNINSKKDKINIYTKTETRAQKRVNGEAKIRSRQREKESPGDGTGRAREV